jgi:hypothetical protein
MLTRLKALVLLPGRIAGGHPGFSELLAWNDGELDGRRQTRIDEHLLGCPKCRLQARRIGLHLARSSRILVDGAESPAVEPGLQRLLRLLRNDARVAEVRDEMREKRNSRLVVELGLYFGSYPMSLLERSADGGSAFQADIDRLASAFLGKKAAVAMLDRIDLEMEVA